MRKSLLVFTWIFCFHILFLSEKATAQCGTTNHAGADWIVTSGTTVGGTHTNVGVFQLSMGVTITLDSACRFFEVQADTILIYGSIVGDGKGDIGGSGGAGGTYANGSAVPGYGGQMGLAGYGTGGGAPGAAAGNGGYIEQICGGLFCAGNQDGYNGGGGGAGGGAGGSYGAKGGAGGYGAYGSGFSGASGGTYGTGGAAANSYGTSAGYDINWGSGGAGGGGGGGGWSAGTAGGKGGAGGGMVVLKAQKRLIVSGNISCAGSVGGNGGTGGGESDDNSYDCSTTGYNACGICTESVYDAAGGAGGAAGGGSGGGIYLESNGYTSITGVLTANGGAGGAAGVPDTTFGTCYDYARGGGGGGGGRVKILTNPCITSVINPVCNVSGGTGGTGLITGYNGGMGSFEDDLVSQSHIPLNAGVIDDIDSVICDFGDVPLIASISAATGGMGTYTYQWEYSTSDSLTGYVNYPGQTGATLDPGTISTTTWYRRKAVSGSCDEYSNAVQALVIDCSGFEENTEMVFDVYPVPNNGTFTISASQPLADDAVLIIFNSTGETVYSNHELGNRQSIVLSPDLQPGLYVVYLYSDKSRGLRKMVIE